jgi:hypothetical protein
VPPDKWDTTIIVTDLKQISTGTNSKTGAPYTLYQVEATKPDGQRIDNLKLRTFQDLPKHEAIEVTIKRFVSEQYGESYTIERKGKSRSQQRLDELESRVKALEEWKEHAHRYIQQLLAERSSAPSGVLSPLAAPSPPPATPSVTAENYGQQQPAPPPVSDDNIPF